MQVDILPRASFEFLDILLRFFKADALAIVFDRQQAVSSKLPIWPKRQDGLDSELLEIWTLLHFPDGAEDASDMSERPEGHTTWKQRIKVMLASSPPGLWTCHDGSRCLHNGMHNQYAFANEAHWPYLLISHSRGISSPSSTAT